MKRLYLIVIAVLVLGLTAHAIDLNVYCGQKRFPNSINAALKLLNPEGPNTLTVFGTCNENVLIAGFNRLTLRTTKGATINDASGGTDVTVYIDTSTVALQGLTINGGVVGVNCYNLSVCRFDGNTVQGASVAGIQFGSQSRGAFGANTIQNNGIYGLVLIESCSAFSFGGLVIHQNLASGIYVAESYFSSGWSDTIQQNGGDGITLDNNASLSLNNATITGNAGQGVAVLGHSSAEIGTNNVVTGNGYDGVLLRDLSYVNFSGISNITGNTILDVECQDYFTVVRGVTNIGGGITNCTNASAPQPSGLNRPLTRSR